MVVLYSHTSLIIIVTYHFYVNFYLCVTSFTENKREISRLTFSEVYINWHHWELP